jgi:uncharacterized protein YyaL (SSP411 family)
LKVNRLAQERSPYLQQHAQNPVNWYPWGEEAFEKARKEDKPIFLSIGYSTCHWCHVMERESFENQGTADILNRDFVAIKVDREERPDVDRIYMSYVQAATGSGGWPMSVWLTPGLQPFIGGTYYPPENKYGRAGFPLMLERIAKAWREERDRIVESSASVVEQLREQADAGAAGRPDEEALERGFAHFRRAFDSRLGGFGGAPKFPRPVVLNFLLRYYARTKNEEALEMVLETLRAMAKGGMHDQLGGGFHRYSVDEYWFVPHFEKMLYDQAQLVISYLEAYQITHDEGFSDVARRTLDYVLRDMTNAEGGFYSAEDADSVIDPAHPHEKGEGAFYVWTAEEIESIAGQPAARYFEYRYGVEAHGNVRNDPHAEFTGKNILFEAHTLEETEHHFEAAVRTAIGDAVGRLLAERGKRVRPHLDDKILTAWNGLMISAFAKAGAVLGEHRYAEAARRAKEFVVREMYREGTLLRRYHSGDAAIPGFLDDYAFFIQALIDSGDIALATELTEKQIALFEDSERGGFFSTATGDLTLILRLKEDYDGAEPSGNSVAALNLLRLARITGRADFQRAGIRTLQAFAARINQAPYAAPQLLVAYEFSGSAPKQVVLAGEELSEMERAFHQKFLPDYVLIKDRDEMPAIGGKATAYVCENFTCQLPVTDIEQFRALLQ